MMAMPSPDDAVLARRAEDLGNLESKGSEKARWVPARANPQVGIWTDDYSNLLSVMNW